tara:strand:+ start:3448 stop:7059 length:3612 start_codon:yes stop_codon:yes gene_type:complete
MAVLMLSVLFSAAPLNDSNGIGENFDAGNNGLGRIGDYGYPNNPMNDRAKGFSIQGKARSALLNYGAYIDWDYNPSGGWGNYAYLPSVAFMAGVPGYIPSSDFNWQLTEIEVEAGTVSVWVSTDAYDAWSETLNYLGQPGRFSGIAYNLQNDAGDLALKRGSIDKLGASRFECEGADYENQNDCEENGGEWNYADEVLNHGYALEADFEWFIDTSTEDAIFLYMIDSEVDPNDSDSQVGLVYPWAFRPKLDARYDEYDLYDYGVDDEEWTEDDYYFYYGANTAESWMSRWSPKINTDWHAATKSSINSHSTQYSAGDLFGNTIYTGDGDTYPLLAHSNYPSTWPISFNTETLEDEPFWPGWYGDEYYGDDPDLWLDAGIDVQLCGSNPSRTNPECWKELSGRFISDSDIYMEFDDRWAHRANMINSDNEYEQTGYPLGLTVMSMAHSYGVSYAEDIMFVTVKVRNESGDYDYAFKRNKFGQKEYLLDYNDDFISGEGLIMPDGTKLNGGRGFNYEEMALGFYMDADVLMGNLEGYNSALHTNADDFMEYYDCANPDIVDSEEWSPYTDGCPVVDGDTLRISMAMIYDYNGESGGVEGFGYEAQTGNSGGLGIVATQLLDSPYATKPVDLNQDGFDDIFPGEKLKMTDWHWFDWYNRPGVVTREGNNNCCAGDPGKPMAQNKEEIQYKLLSGDNSNLSDNEKLWYFHTANPDTDSDSELNPHFDSLEGLKETTFFNQGEEGLDCVLIMSCAPFDLEVGEEVDFSFCIIYGEDRSDLLKNAEFAQIMYNAHYQGYTAPRKPKVAVTSDHNLVKIHWTDSPQTSKDVITSYTDFEGFKLYKSKDGGETWGSDIDKVYDGDNVFVGWQPYKQFDLSAAQDEAFCVLGFEDNCYIDGVLNSDYNTQSLCESACDDTDDCEYSAWLNFNDINQDGFWNAGEEYTCKGDIKRGISVSGEDPKAPWFNLGFNTGLDDIIPCDCVCTGCDNCSNEFLNQISSQDCIDSGWEWNCECDYYTDSQGTTYQYTFVDSLVTDGFEYTYSVTAYDTGVMSDEYVISIDDGEVTIDTLSVPDPNGWGAINSFQYLENSKGTTEYDDNFVKVIPGYNAQSDWSNTFVSPNPFIVRSSYERDEVSLQLTFNGLPSACKIKIYTVTGELINEFRHNGDGPEFWNLRNQNNQEVAAGLYIYTIEDLTSNNNEPYIGKFVIIR